MREVKIGDRIRDNDPRPGWQRTLVVSAFCTVSQEVNQGAFIERRSAPGVVATGGVRPTRIRLSRIHTDGKPRKSGWSLVMDGAA